MRLVNKVALITGAGGPMGRAIAQKLACEGANLVLTDISGTRLNESVETIAAAHPQFRLSSSAPTASMRKKRRKWPASHWSVSAKSTS